MKKHWLHNGRLLAAFVSIFFMSGFINAEPSTLQYSPPSAQKFREAIDSLKSAQQPELKRAEEKVFPVFIFIPGILGSKLSKLKDGKEIIFWGKIDWSDLTTDNPDFAYNKNDVISATPLDALYLPLNKDIDVYGNAYTELKAITGVPGNVLRFAYDWRQSNTISAVDLSKWLCRPDIFEKVKSHPVVFIAHSMGGLVLKYWLEHFYDQPSCSNPSSFSNWLKVQKVVLVGTPNFGAPKAILSFSQGTTLYIDPANDQSIWRALLTRFDMETVSRNLNKYGLRFPSAYELLPIVNTTGNTNGCFRRPGWQTAIELRMKDGLTADVNLFDPDWWHELGWPAQMKQDERESFIKGELPKLLGSAEQFLCDVANYDVDSRFDVIHVSGFDQPTICKIIFEQPDKAGSTSRGKPNGDCPGDGTVPEWIASDTFRPRANRISDNESHSKLVGAKEFFVYLQHLHVELTSEFVQQSPSQADGIDATAKVLSKLRYIPPAPANIAGDDSKSSAVAERVVEQLNISPEHDIYQAARHSRTKTSIDANRRAVAYRVFADLRGVDQRSRVWALNNSAHISLTKKDFGQALSLSKQAIAIANSIKTSDAKIRLDLKDLKSKAAWTAAIAAAKLGQKADAIEYRKVAIQNGSRKARRQKLP